MDFRIQRASAGAIDAVAPLFDDYRQFYGLASDLPAAGEYLAERLEKDQSVLLIAVLPEGDVIGFTQLYPTFSSLSMTRALVLYDLYVAPAARRMGVGRALLEAVRLYAIESGAVYIRLETAVDNLPAQRLYESLGYSRDEAFYTYYLQINTA